jgi:hypothetical protein
MNTYNPSDNILLYAKFDNTKDQFVVPPTVEVLFIKDNEITTLLNTEMQTNDNIDYRQGVGSDAGSLLYSDLTVI